MAAGIADGYLALPLGRFLDAVAATEPTPGGGAVAAVTVGLAGGLVAMAAGFSASQLDDAAAFVASADVLRARVAPLAEQDAAAYADVLAAYALPKDRPGREQAVHRALSRAADVPLEVAEAGAEVARLAARVERDGNPNLRGDTVTARLLAAAAVRAAVALVQANLSDRTDPRVARARALGEEARWSGW